MGALRILWHARSYLLSMDFKAQMASGKAVEILSDGTQQAPFSYDFALDAKALEHTVDDNGDLWIEGYASDFGIDRQEEAFETGSFERGLKTFLARNPIMLYHHQYDKALGQFTDARVDDRGLWVKGRVDAPATGSWAEDVFNKIRKGTIRSFSVGGLFKRRMTKAGPRIYDVDLGEISVTPFPVNPRTTFSVIAKKAFEGIEGVQPPPIDGPVEKHDDDECAECTARAAAAAAKAATERETDEALLKRVIDRERAADQEAAATEAAEETARQKAEAAAGAEREEKPEETPEEEGADLTELFNKLDKLAAKLETVSERWGDDEESEAEEEETEGKAESDGFPTDEELAEEYAEMELIRSLFDSGEPEGKAADHSSTIHPGLNRSFRKNWVEKVGGFPRHNWIYRAAKHLVADAGMDIGRAIAVAVNAAKKLCASGDLNFPGKQSANPGSRAEACAAVAEWNEMKAKSHAS